MKFSGSRSVYVVTNIYREKISVNMTEGGYAFIILGFEIAGYKSIE